MKITVANPLLALDIQIAVSKEETRYYLNGFHVEKAEGGGILLVSTDGHRMLVIHDPLGTIEGETPPILLPQWFLKQIKPELKKGPNKSVRLEISGDVKESSAALLNAADAPLIRADKVLIHGTFPDWRRVMPAIDHNRPFVTGTFNADYYAAFGAFEPKPNRVTAYGNDRNAPFLIKVDGRPDALGVLMPAHTTTSARYPAWIGADVIARCEIAANAEKAA